MFIFSGVLPVIGVTAGIFRKRWAAWILFASPLCSSLAFLFLKKVEFSFFLYFAGIYYLPVLLAGTGFFYLTRNSKTALNTSK